MTAAELAPAASALAQAELAEQPAERFLGAHLAALRVAAVVLAHRTRSSSSRTGSRRAPSSRPRDVWQVLAEVAPEYAEWAGFFAASALKRRAVQAGAVTLVGTREADDLLRDVRLFFDQVAGRLRRTSSGRGGSAVVQSAVAAGAPPPASLAGVVEPLHSSVIPADAGISPVEPLPSSVIPADAGISPVELVETPAPTLPLSPVIPANAGISTRASSAGDGRAAS